MLEGSASIRTAPLGSFNERRVEKSPRNLASWPDASQEMIALHWIQEIHRRTLLIDGFTRSKCRSLRPIAIAPATPSTLDGLCGPEQRNGVGSSFECRGKTLGHRRLLCLACCTASQTQQQGRSSPETLQRSQIFACTAKAKPPPFCVSHTGLVVRFCAHLLRSSSAYVPSARQAGPHAHPL